jgi:FkbM family methyltransferase
METFSTKYGLVTLLAHDTFFVQDFKRGIYWDEDKILQIKQYIDPNRDILEIGGHCGTSSLVYSSFLNPPRKLHVYEPQKNMFNILVKNIEQNGLQDKIIPYNSGVFCYEGPGEMHSMDLDGGGGVVAKAYAEPSKDGFNFGGVGLGKDGEPIHLTTVDRMGLDNIGFIHCDAQGSEHFLFSKAVETIRKCRPVILYENGAMFDGRYHNHLCNMYPQYEKESMFNVSDYCIDELGYSNRVNLKDDILLVP